MKRWLIVLIVCVASVPGAAAAQSPTTTIPPAERSGQITTVLPSAEMDAPPGLNVMEWVQSLSDDPAFAGFTIERSVIIVARVPGREFASPIPPIAESVTFVDARLSQQEFASGAGTATELLRAVNTSVIGLGYDPLADHITISREPDRTAISDLTEETIEKALAQAFGPAIEGIGHHVEVIWTPDTVPEPTRNASVPGVGEPTEVTVLCEDARTAAAARRGARSGFWALPGRVSGQLFGTEWDWFCRVMPESTTNTDRLIYALLGLVVALGVAVAWALSAKSTVERRLWEAMNPKSQQAM